MSEVSSTVSQLIRAYKTHLKVSNATDEDISHWLLLFYAVECGLKAKYLKEHRAQSTADFRRLFSDVKKYGHSHDIWEWVKALNMPKGSFSNTNGTPISQMHERLRYGVFTGGTPNEKDQIKFLKDIAVNLKNKI